MSAPLERALADAKEITEIISPGVGKLDSFVGQARRVAQALIESEKQRERQAALIQSMREAMEPLRGKSLYFPNEPPLLVDICVQVRTLQKIDAALAQVSASPKEEQHEWHP